MKKLVIALIIIFSFLIAVVKNDIKLNPESQSRDSRDLLGDINQDGTVNLSDVLQIVGMIMGLIEPTEYMLWAADVNFDNTHDIFDVIGIVEIILADDSITDTENYYITFNGDGSYVDLDMPEYSTPWTIECDINKNGGTPFSHLVTHSDGGSGIRLEQWYNNNQVGITDYGTMDYFFGYELPAGIWKHLAVINNGQQMKLYINGNLEGNIDASVDCPTDLIGLDNELGAINSKLDNLRFWNTALSSITIETFQDSLNLESHPNLNNLFGHFQFNNPEGVIMNSVDPSQNAINHGGSFEQIFNRDVGVLSLDSPQTGQNNYGSNENIDVTIANFGTSAIIEEFNVSYSLNGGEPVSVNIENTGWGIPANSTVELSFPNVDLSFSGVHHFQIYTSLEDDEYPGNDTLDVYIYQNNNTVGDVTAFETSANNDTVTINNNLTEFRILFYTNDIFRIWMTPNGIFEDPAGTDIVVHNQPPIAIQTSDEGEYYKISSNSVILRVYKTPLIFAMYETDNTTVIWEESSPITFGEETHQYLYRGENEYFYGCGMQNGYFSHRDQSIEIRLQISSWDDGAVPGPAPFFMSTAGYGVYRNTFKPGQYDFFETLDLEHEEIRFDAYYFRGPSLKNVLNGYTQITGRPFLPPRWALSFGDADCYSPTSNVVSNIAETYRELDMPGGWILPNDGYGCGYTNLPEVVSELENLGFKTGLWTEDGVDQQTWEVGTAGIRCSKLDVAWIGSGYQWAFHGCRQAYTGIEANSDARGFVWSVSSWAGTQRYSTVWSGDEYGTWEYIRYHIPTITGSGLSGLNYATGDVDGIFGGSGPTYTRDLQWKCFTPVLMVISGWAPANKQPWTRGQPYTDINRDYLKLKMRLTPYMYSYCNIAYETGIPAVRAMVLEFPDDPVTWGTETQYQFMSGEWFLVAPIYQNSYERDNIYLPSGLWFDYWDGTQYAGNQILNNYSAPLEKLPLFVKGGAIIPMYSEMLYDNEIPADTLTLDCYPHEESSFTLYEDDGLTRQHRTGSFAKQTFNLYGSENDIQFTIGESMGDYEGKYENRIYRPQFHVNSEPASLTLDDASLTQYETLEEFGNATDGWYFENSIVYVKTNWLATDTEFNIELVF